MKTCFYCKKAIKPKEQYCSLISYDKGSISHEDHWHRGCFATWIEDKVDTRVQQLAKALKEQAMPLIKAKMGMVA
jgi:hypothetical protein